MKKTLLKIVFAFTFFLFAFTFASNVSAKENGLEVVTSEANTERARVSSGDYTLVTSKSQLTLGSKVVIASARYNYVMSATQSSNNRRETYLAKKTSDGTSVVTPTSSVGTFTLVEGYTSGTYALYDSNYGGYLCAASSSSNTLKTARDIDSYSSFTISISSNGVASLTANYFTRNKLRYNYYSGVFACYRSGQQDIALYQEYTGGAASSNVAVTGVSLNTTSASLTVGETLSLTATVRPSNATNKNVSWSTSNSSVATVSNGYVAAKAAGSARITVTTADGGYYAYADITVSAASGSGSGSTPVTNKDAWTIMIYMCGADLESDHALASSDISEILAVSGQPSDVNIILQTGGATKWNSSYGINASYTQRYHVANRKLVLDSSLSRANMGNASTFQSFLEWGLTNYPAEKTGVIMWNHGGAMRGVCYDENYSSDSLLNSEVNSAVANAFSRTNQTSKLEFIGYDACLMNVQDVAEFNSSYFNYMIASEESEAGYGWDYDTWVDDLYAKKSTSTILKAIVDGFIRDNGGTSSYSNNQTLSYLNLAYMSAYKTAWENMAYELYYKLSSSNKNSFINLVKSCKHYADSDYVYYGIFDAKDFVNKLSANSTFNPGSTYTNAVLNAFNNLVEYSSCGRGAGNSNGMCMYFSVSSNCAKGSYYTSAQTNFSNWRALNSTYGA